LVLGVPVSEKIGTTLRLTKSTRDRLNQAAVILRRTKSQIVEDALADYFEEQGIGGAYQLTLTSERAVLLRLDDPPKVLDISERNGVSPEKIVKKYSEKLQAPVRLVLQEEG
jgi:hypothetical protein